jgi:hypothetical protein
MRTLDLMHMKTEQIREKIEIMKKSNNPFIKKVVNILEKKVNETNE